MSAKASGFFEPYMVHNSIQCLECGQILVSRHIHDLQTCSCPNMATVDGGVLYTKTGAKDPSKLKDLCIYSDDDFEKIRIFASRGTRGEFYDEILHYIPLALLTDQHLQNLLMYTEGYVNQNELLKREAEYRRKNKELWQKK